MPTRHERLSLHGRRLEAAALLGTVLLTLLLCQLAPARGDSAAADGARTDSRTARPHGIPSHTAAGVRSDAANAGRTTAALPRSAPVRLRVARTGTDARVATVAGLPRTKGPPPPTGIGAVRVAWYRGGPSPGEPGPALLVGQLDGRGGRSALSGLGGLRRGAMIDVWRTDGSRARFVTDAVVRYGTPGGGATARFPGTQVYGPNERPELRLIARTGGTGAGGRGVVVFGHLIGDPV